ncbi:hypothetical protein AAF712_002369 [Marasmius tenuissimus]|uniref:L-dopachrome isomerase n=1 Tax=Marasmius tenuissimus TaxID=585030 RepID=A0ABR3AAI3_9AGAR|nr:hypothetical protein PM082_020486 [Marasmius tenuissimus]
MPVIDLKTNVKIDDIPSFVLKLSKRAAEIVGKPEAVINVILSQDVPMSFGGKLDPAYHCTITLAGDIEPEAYSAGFSKFFEETLGVPNDRGVIPILNLKGAHLCWQGTTIKGLFGVE